MQMLNAGLATWLHRNAEDLPFPGSFEAYATQPLGAGALRVKCSQFDPLIVDQPRKTPPKCCQYNGSMAKTCKYVTLVNCNG
jgi:hypothetical protein